MLSNPANGSKWHAIPIDVYRSDNFVNWVSYSVESSWCCVFCFLIIITDTIDHAVDHEYDARPSSCRPSKSDQKIGITITNRYIIDSVFFYVWSI